MNNYNKLRLFFSPSRYEKTKESRSCIVQKTLGKVVGATCAILIRESLREGGEFYEAQLCVDRDLCIIYAVNSIIVKE